MSLQTITLLFDELLHKYTDECGNPYTSVTQVITKYEKPFNREYWLYYSALKEFGYKLRPDVDNLAIYVGKKSYSLADIKRGVVFLPKDKVEELNKKWIEINKEACERGNNIHKFLEDQINLFTKTGDVTFNDVILNGLTAKYKRKISTLKDLDSYALKDKYPDIHEKVKSFLSTGWILFAELRIYHNGFLIAGTIDLVAFKDGKFVIIDWKTNKKELYFKSGYYKKVNGYETDEWVDNNDKFLYPLQTIPFCKGELYTLQLSLYAYILECWGFTCDGLLLFHMRPNKKEKLYKIKYRKDDVTRMAKHHAGQLVNDTQLKIGLNSKPFTLKF